MSGWTELFHGKSSIYALDEVSKEWLDRGISGQIIMFQNQQFRSDIRIKWSKNQREIWWRLMNGKLKPKGERAWVLKAWDTSNNKQEILAIRFSDIQLSTQFSIKFHQIFPPQQPQQPQPPQRQGLPPPNINVPVQQQRFPQQQQYFNQNMGMMGMNAMNNPLMMGGMMGGPMMGMGGNNNMHNGVSGYNGYMMNANANNNKNAAMHQKNGTGKTWECAVCTYSNDMSKASCIMCGLSQDSTQKANGKKITIDPSKQPMVPPSPANHMMIGNGNHPQPRGFFGHGAPPGPSPTEFSFQENALKARKQNSLTQQQMLSQFESHQMAASAITSPHTFNPRNPPHGIPQGHKRKNSWICPMCTLHNSVSVTRCDACNASRNIKNSGPTYDMVHKNPYDMMNNNMKNYNNPNPNPNPMMNNMNMNMNMNVNNGAANNNYGNNNIQRAASVQEFQQSASDIACYNDAPSQVFSTLRSVAKKLLKDDVRYRTLDTTNPKVMERLIGFEGVLDFLMLLGFESDAMGMKLICEQKPSQQVVRNAIQVLNTYESRLGLGRKKKRNADDHDDGQSYATPGGFDADPKGADEEEEDTLTLEQIIIWSTHESMRDNDTMETLILTHKQFTNSLLLLKNLRRRFNVAIPLDIKNNESKTSEFRLNVEKRIQLKVIKSLRDWMKTYWDDDFLNELEVQKELTSWIRDLNDLAHTKRSECPWIEPLSSMVSKEYERFKLKSPNEQKRKENDEIYKLNADTGVPVHLESVSIKKGYKLSNTTAEDLADAVTLMNYKIFSNIKQRECIGQSWKKKKAQSPNVLAMIQQFNNLTVFVQLQILSEKSLKDRSKSIKRVIKMGERFKELKNYNSLCAILGALNSSPIHRLKAAWQRVPEKQLNHFEGFKQIFVNTRNFRNFRKLFRTTSPPAIPYFGLFLQDLVFIDDGNDSFKQIDNFKQHGFMVNFNKCIRTMDRIKNIRLYQTNPYQAGKHLKSQPFLQKILYQEFHKMKDYTEDKIWNMSTQVKKADEGK